MILVYIVKTDTFKDVNINPFNNHVNTKLLHLYTTVNEG